MMLHRILILGILVCALAQSTLAKAERRTFGVGVVVPSPTGITAQYLYDRKNAMVASLGWGEDYIHLNLDHLWLKTNLVKVDKRPLAVYYGIGLRWINNDEDNTVGIRAPLGAQHLFREVPIQIFIELSPFLNLVERSSFGVDVALGARYFF